MVALYPLYLLIICCLATSLFQTMSQTPRPALWSNSGRKHPKWTTLNKDTANYTASMRLQLLDGKMISGLADFTSGLSLTNLFCPSASVTPAGVLDGLVGSTFDSTTDVVPLKLPPGALGYCSTLVKKEDLAPDALPGPTPLTPEHLKGTKWEASSVPIHFETRPVSFIYSKCVPPLEGNLADDDFVDAFAKNTSDAQAWIEHIRSAVSNNVDINAVLKRVKDAGDEKKYIAANYDEAEWNPTGPCVDHLRLSPEEMKASIARLKADMKITPPAAPVKQPSPSDPSTAPPTKPKQLSGAQVKHNVFHVRGKINWTSPANSPAIEGELLPPRWTDAVISAWEKTSGPERHDTVRRAWKTTLKPRVEDPLESLAEDPAAQLVS